MPARWQRSAALNSRLTRLAHGPPRRSGRCRSRARAPRFRSTACSESSAWPGPIYSITPSTVTVQVPWEAAGASRAYLKVRNGNPSDHFVFQLAEVAPGIFQYESGGRSYALALHPDSSAVTAESPAARGAAVSIAMTGNGPVVMPPRTGSAGGFSNETVTMPTVWIGDQQGTVVYSGLDPRPGRAVLGDRPSAPHGRCGRALAARGVRRCREQRGVAPGELSGR